jgi:hypothetical protein
MGRGAEAAPLFNHAITSAGRCLRTHTTMPHETSALALTPGTRASIGGRNDAPPLSRVRVGTSRSSSRQARGDTCVMKAYAPGRQPSGTPDGRPGSSTEDANAAF